MSNAKVLKRLITCQGSIQLVTALSVLSFREKEQHELGFGYENYLVIYDLYAPSGQIDEFSIFIERMAKLIYQWKKIVYIRPEQMQSILEKLKSFSSFKIPSLVHELVGLKNPDEIYLCRNWQFSNQLLINAYRSAEKICYGDSIGIYFSESALSPVSLDNDHQLRKSHYALYSYFKEKLKFVRQEMKKLVSQRIALKKIEFDIGYFLLPNALGESPPMKVITIDKSIILNTFQRLRSLLDIDYISNLLRHTYNVPISILLTSNFSEAGRTSLENEIAAYRKLLESHRILKGSVLLIKPHPRDSRSKMQKLKASLSDLYLDILLLSEITLFYLPFEILFMEVFLREDNKPQNLRVFTFSSACLSLEFLFMTKCFIGFGSDIIKELFYEDYAPIRIKHEADLISAVQEIRCLNDSIP